MLRIKASDAFEKLFPDYYYLRFMALITIIP